MNKILLVLLVSVFLFSCDRDVEAFVSGRMTDWEKDALNTPVLLRTTLVYALTDLSQSNEVKAVQKIRDIYSVSGDKQLVEYYSSTMYDKLKKSPSAQGKPGDYRLYLESKLEYNYTNRENTYFISSKFTNILNPGYLNWQQEWIYSAQGRPIGESYYYEDQQGRESYFVEFSYDKSGFKNKELYTGEYRGIPESYIRYIENDTAGRETNSMQVIGIITNRSRIAYNLNGKILSKDEVDMQLNLFAHESYNNYGHIIKRLIVDGNGKKAEYKYYYDYDDKANIKRSWITVGTRKNGFKHNLMPMSYRTYSYDYLESK